MWVAQWGDSGSKLSSCYSFVPQASQPSQFSDKEHHSQYIPIVFFCVGNWWCCLFVARHLPGTTVVGECTVCSNDSHTADQQASASGKILEISWFRQGLQRHFVRWPGNMCEHDVFRCYDTNLAANSPTSASSSFFRTKQLFGKEEDVLQSETNVSDLDNFLSTGVAHWKQALVNAFTFLALKGAFSTLE